MPESLQKLRIFAASPSDVTNERAKLETVVDSLKPMADYLGLTLEVIDWRAVVPDAGRPQQIIFDQLKPTSWDIFIGILWHRFGTPPGATDKTGKDYLSGTKEEFKTAYELWKQHSKPRMVLYRCTRALPFDVDPDQLKHMREFFKLLEDTKGDYQTLYQAFDTTKSFEKLVLNNLQKLLAEYGEESKTPITPEVEQVLAPKIPNNLPRRQAFFGRAKEMDIVMHALSPDDRTWGILVDGIGGIGKSAIAVEAAYRAQETNSFDAFVFVTAKTKILDPSGIKELNPPARTLDEFLNETARVLGQSGIAKLTGDEKRTALIDFLCSMRTLLIYDNLETLSKAEQEWIADFLRELPQGCKAIITSRRRGGEGGVWLRLEKLDWDAARGIIEYEMARDGGLADKLNRAQARWQELFDETNGSPLGLVHTLGLMRVRVSLTFDGALEMLRGNRDEDLQKFVFQEAYKELTENDKVALGALSFFVPSATYEAWMQVANLSRIALETTIDRLSALSLVDILIGDERYALHPLTRAFVRNELLADVNVLHTMGTWFAQYWVNYAGRHGHGTKDNYKTFNQLEAEWLNLETAADWLWKTANLRGNSVGNKDAARMLNNMVNVLNKFFMFYGLWDEWIQLNTQSYEVMYTLNEWDKAGLCAYNVASAHYGRACIDDMEFWVDRCEKAWSHSGSQHRRATVKELRGNLARQRKQLEYAQLLFQDALNIWRSLGQDREVAITLKDLGYLERDRKNYDTAEQYFRESLDLAWKINDKELITLRLGNLGEIELDRKKWLEAHKWFEQELLLAKEVGRQDLIARAEYGLARVYNAEERLDLALPLARDAMKIYERLQHRNLVTLQEFVEMLRKKMKSGG